MTYRERFPNRAVFPVIHVQDYDQVAHNLDIARTHEADGVFLICHQSAGAARVDPLVDLVLRLRGIGWHEKLWIGANFLGLPYPDAFVSAYRLALNGVWADNIEALSPTAVSPRIVSTNVGLAFPLSFGGIAFKYQPQHGDGTGEARRAAELELADVLTTSGPATGEPAPLEKLAHLREAIDDYPLAVASGVTPENAAEQLHYVDAVLVATGINRDDGSELIDPKKLQRLVDVVHSYQPPAD